MRKKLLLLLAILGIPVLALAQAGSTIASAQNSPSGSFLAGGSSSIATLGGLGPVYNVTSNTYGAVADWRTVSDAVCSNSSANWSSATLALTQSDVGKSFWAHPAANQTTITTAGALSQFTVASVLSPTTWTATTNTSGSGCGSAIVVDLGTDASVAINLAAAAMHTATRGTMYIPCGDYAIANKIWTQFTSGDAITIIGGGMGGTTSGTGLSCTRLHLSPGIGWSAGSTAMNSTATELIQNIAFDGDSTNVPQLNNSTLFGWGGALTMENTTFTNFYGTAVNQILVSQSGDDNGLSRVAITFNGGTAFQFHSLNLNCFDCIFQGSPGAQLADLGTIATFVGGAIVGVGGSANALQADGVSGGGIGVSFIGTTFTAGNNAVPIINVSNSNITDLRLINPVFNNGGSSSVNLLTVASGASVFMSGMTTKGTGTGMTITNSGTLRDGCGNNMTNVTATGQILGTCGSSGITKLCAAVGSGASPSVAACGNANSGVFSCATAAVTTCTVNSTGVTAGSVVHVQQDTSTTTGTALGVTCNVTTNVPVMSAKVAATSFSITIAQPVTNPACYSYYLSN